MSAKSLCVRARHRQCRGAHPQRGRAGIHGGQRVVLFCGAADCAGGCFAHAALAVGAARAEQRRPGAAQSACPPRAAPAPALRRAAGLLWLWHARPERSVPRRLHALPARACHLASPVPCTCSTGVPDQRGRTAAAPAARGPTGARPAGALGRPGAGAAAAQRRVRAHLPRHFPGHLRHCKGARRATCSDAAPAARPTAVCTSHAAAARLRTHAAAAIGLCMRPRRQPLDMLAILF